MSRILFDYCVKCGTEHGYMNGPCEKCGGTTFSKKTQSFKDIRRGSDEEYQKHLEKAREESKCKVCSTVEEKYWSLNGSKDKICSKCVVPYLFHSFGWSSWLFIKCKLLGMFRNILS